MEAGLSPKQFDVLTQFVYAQSALSQRRLEELTGHSLGTVNRVVKELTEAGLVADNRIVPRGMAALRCNPAMREVVIAAGGGQV